MGMVIPQQFHTMGIVQGLEVVVGVVVEVVVVQQVMGPHPCMTSMEMGVLADPGMEPSPDLMV